MISSRMPDRFCVKPMFGPISTVKVDFVLDYFPEDKLIGEFTQPAFRYKLRDALDGSEGDMMKQAW